MKNVLASCLIVIAAAACGEKKEAQVVAPTPKAPAAAQTAAAASKLTGKVAETFDAAGYTYVRVQTSSGDQWAAVPQTKIAKDAPVTINAQMTLDNFESKSLNRTFDHIVFGNVEGTEPAATQPMTSASSLPPDHPPIPHASEMKPSEAAAASVTKVAKAAGANAYTVAEIWSQRTSLANQPVVVHAKVVKFLGGIMGRNWIHIRDGSGSADKSNHDLTVTTQGTVRVGDVVTVNGVVHIDKDFGAGYSYPVIIEAADVR